MAINPGLFSSSTPEYETPADLFSALDAEFGPFDLDPCANDDNHKCPTYYTKSHDGLLLPWFGKVFMNPPYGNDRSIFPLKSLKRAHFLINILSKSRDFGQDTISLSDCIDILSKKFQNQKGLLSFNEQKWQEQSDHMRNIFASSNPFPRDTFIELSGLFSRDRSDSQRALQELYRRFMDHLNLQIGPIDKRTLTGLTSCTGFSLMDVYAALTIDNPSTPSKFIIHNLIIPVLRGYIKWCKTAISGIGKWVEKAYQESQGGVLVVCLLPARTDTRWFHDFCVKGEIRFLRGRLKFGNQKNPAPFPSMVVIFKGDSK